MLLSPNFKKFLAFLGIALVILACSANLIVSLLLKSFERKAKLSAEIHPHWQRYTNHEYGYVVDFPSRPFKKPAQLTNNPALVSYQQMLSVLGSNDCFMVATVVTSLTNDFTEEQIESLLDTSMSGGLGKGGKIISEHKIKFGTYLGKELEAEIAGKFFVRMRFYQVGHNLQEALTLTSLTNQHSKNASRFLDSFRVISE